MWRARRISRAPRAPFSTTADFLRLFHDARHRRAQCAGATGIFAVRHYSRYNYAQKKPFPHFYAMRSLAVFIDCRHHSAKSKFHEQDDERAVTTRIPLNYYRDRTRRAYDDELPAFIFIDARHTQKKKMIYCTIPDARKRCIADAESRGLPPPL